MALVITVLSLPGPLVSKVIIDNVYPQRDVSLLSFILIVGATLSIFLGIAEALNGYFQKCVDINMNFDLQSRLYKHIQSQDFSFFDKREVGEVLSRFRDMENAVDGAIGVVNTLVFNLFQLAIFPAVLLYINWKLALISLAVLPMDILLATVTRKYTGNLSRVVAERAAELSAKSFESVSSIRTIQALGLEGTFYNRLRELFAGVSRVELKAGLFANGTGVATTTMATCGSLAYGWYGWNQVLQGNLSLGSFIAFSGYVGYLSGPLRSLIDLIPRLETIRVHAKRFFELYHRQPDIRDRDGAAPLEMVRGDIRFEEVCFAYDPTNKVLRGVNLEVPRSTTTALVGKSGSGKSTLVKLIPRFYEPEAGKICIEGRDVREYTVRSLRSKIGFALQGSTVFQGSILENLTFGQEIPLSDVETSLQQAHIYDFVSSLADGFDSIVGEQGVNMSEGQKQRLALARVLLLDKPILILDEPTAALDHESEFHIQEALKIVKEGRTTIIIAHRFSTIQHADTIAVLDNGVIAEHGSHDDLLQQGGVYSHLCALT